MTIVYAAAASHAPGMTAWPDTINPSQLQTVHSAFATIASRLKGAKADRVILLTSEHWNNFFLDHMSAFCVGRAETFAGPVEPWLKVEKTQVSGDPALAEALLTHCYQNDFELGYSHELSLDHGSMLPIKFAINDPACKIVPLFFNTLATPRPSPKRCMRLGQVLRPFLEERPERIAIVATGGMSHDPGEKNHGRIDTDFDRLFLKKLSDHDLSGLESYQDDDLMNAGAGTLELLAWICLAGIMGERGAETIAYETIPEWATGFGVVDYKIAGASI